MSGDYQPDLAFLLAAETRAWNDIPGHWLTLVPEEPCGQDRMWSEPFTDVWPGPRVRGLWDVPWLRPVCSCGWKGGAKRGRFVISENAIWYWRTKHIERAAPSVAPEAEEDATAAENSAAGVTAGESTP